MKTCPNRGRTPLLAAWYRHRSNDMENGERGAQLVAKIGEKVDGETPLEKWGEGPRTSLEVGSLDSM